MPINNSLLSSINSSIRQPSPLQINRAAVSANITLLFGYTFGLWFQIYEFTGRAREKIAIAVYLVGFSLIVISGIIEFSIDICQRRTMGHGRYHSGSTIVNYIISILFIAMGILDIVGFYYWMIEDFDTENKVLLCSAYLLVIVAVLSLFFQIKQEQDEGTNFNDFIPDGLGFTIDLISNGFVFIGAVWYIVFQHLEVSGQKDFGDVPDRMELQMMILFFVSAALYVIADSLRFFCSGSVGTTQSQPTPAAAPTIGQVHEDEVDWRPDSWMCERTE
mmetsp:Transcript_19033/g.27093  ORF Transcript_19033/g.27093 Transcript_19033/m.27093 type:complete len:276 (+) Transcript_19033:86-913(+)